MTSGDQQYVDEQATWNTCAECGVEGDALEADSDNPTAYYCLDCWQRWETAATAGGEALKTNVILLPRAGGLRHTEALRQTSGCRR